MDLHTEDYGLWTVDTRLAGAVKMHSIHHPSISILYFKVLIYQSIIHHPSPRPTAHSIIIIGILRAHR